MKKTNFSFSWLFAFILFCGCQNSLQETERDNLNLNTKISKSMADSLANIPIGYNEVDTNLSNKKNELKFALTTTDWSGKVTFELVSKASAWNEHNDGLTLAVDPDFVCVGGGCNVSPLYAGYGAYIYESRPMLDKTGWVASSKDHLWVNYHNLDMWAIGIKLEGVSKQT
jgi:hypothetical protein